jgi:hypothetical protein
VLIRVVQPSSDKPLTKEDGSPSSQLNSWLKIITDRALIIGTGSPEAIVEAHQGALYLDDEGLTGALLYIKREEEMTGDKTKGWIPV